MVKLVEHIGRYFVLLSMSFRRPENGRILRKRIVEEIEIIGINSLGIVALLSIFMGAVISLQTASNIDSPLIPAYTVGYAVRQSVILEFSPTIIALILAGKVGSNIASEIGTMRVTEQIDALEIMGVNSAGYLILPKVIAAVFINPFLIIISMALGVLGGWVAVVTGGFLTTSDYVYGITFDFKVFSVVYALIKTVIFAIVITSISSYQGFYTRGGALEVGASSTKAVVYSSIVILILNYIITQLLLI
tara:strand:- start:129696 stop:130439 length:744 start_codon:yes stop_codon:yes gene_type:complete